MRIRLSVPCFSHTESIRAEKQSQQQNFNFFDISICNQLAGRKGIAPHTELFGKSFEPLIFCELNAYCHCENDLRPLFFVRDHSGLEVDFIPGDACAIEVKSTSLVKRNTVRQLVKFIKEKSMKHAIIVSLDESPRRIGTIDILQWREFLLRL